MNDKCPKCEATLNTKLMKTKDMGGENTLNRIRNRALICPDCGSYLRRTPHPFDSKIQVYLLWPLFFVLPGVILKSEWLFYLVGFLLIISIAHTVKKISEPEYKNWQQWHLYDE